MLTTEKSKIGLSQVMDYAKFGDLHRLLRVTAYIVGLVRLRSLGEHQPRSATDVIEAK